MKKFIFVFIILLGTLGSTAYAVSVSSLYSATISVASSSDEVRQQAILQALKQVLVKVSGQSSIASNDQIAPTLSHPERYIQDYAYSDDESGALMLNVRFSPSSVNSLLRQLNQPVWGQNRPLTLVWILMQGKQGSHLVSGDPSNSILQTIQKNADARGIPLVFSIMDLQDLQSVTVSDLWTPMVAVVKQASLRYHPDSVLVVSINESQSAVMTARWTLIISDQVMRWETTGSDEQSLIAMGMINVADALAARFSVVSNKKEQSFVNLTVTGLKGIDDYASVSEYLSGLSGVDNVQVLSVTSTEARFHLSLSINLDAWQQQVSLSSIIVPSPKKDEASTQNDLYYYFNGVVLP